MRRPLDERETRIAQLQALVARRVGYLPAWNFDKGDAGYSLLEIAARYLERLDLDYVDAVDGALLAFLDSVGERRLPAQAAEAPLVFKLSDNAASDVGVAAGTQIQAQPPVPADPAQEPPRFSTIEPFTIARASLVHVYSVSPGDDTYADHTDDLTNGFVAFEDMGPIEHAIYLGDALFDLPKVDCGPRDRDDEPAPETIIHLRFDFHKLLQPKEESAKDIEPPTLKVRWEFCSKNGWLPLEEQTSKGRPEHSLFGQEIVVLKKPFGPASKKLTLEGHETYWIRGKLIEPLPAKGYDNRGNLPVVDRVFVTVESVLDGLLPDEASASGLTLDISQPFHPFGRLPRTHDSFYVACREAFQRNHTVIRVLIKFDVPDPAPPVPDLIADYEWEYFNGVEYVGLGTPELADDEYSFRRPYNWQESDVQGTSNYWLRIRVTKQDGGQATTVEPPTDTSTEVSIDQTFTTIDEDTQRIDGTLTIATQPDAWVVSPTIVPLTVTRISFSFYHLSPTEAIKSGVVSNDFIRRDVSSQLRYPGRPFQPFRREGAPRDAVYFAFDTALPPALVSMYVHVDPDAGSTQGLRFVWEYWRRGEWRTLSVRDRTAGLRTSGTIQFVGPWDATPSWGLGRQPLYRVRARLKEGQVADAVPVKAVWFNAVVARDERVYPRMPLGESSGNPKQVVRVSKGQLPILAEEIVEVREWARSAGGPPPFEEDLPRGHYQLINHPETGAIDQVWVQWSERGSLLRSDPDSRHYTIDRTTGQVRFGDGRHGLIPPPGALLRISHRSGGGIAGNVPADTIRAPRTAIPGLDSVTNPLAAQGGAPSEPLADTQRRGPRRIRHGDRALTEADYEWLAREASPAVARARCLSLTGPGGGGRRGFVTLVIIPHSADPQPMPDDTLRARVTAFVAARAPAAIARGVRVEPPTYCPVSISATIFPTEGADLTSLEAALRSAIDGFLHPLMGGPNGEGWRVGARIYLSQVAHLVETHDGVDRALELRVLVNDAEQGEAAALPQHALPSSGVHELTFALEEVC